MTLFRAQDRAQEDKFLSLTLAFANAGGVLRVPRGFAASEPIVLSTRGTSKAVLPLVFVVVEAGAAVSLWDDTSEQKVESERFIWPRENARMIELTVQQLHWLLEGIDLAAMRGHEIIRYKRAA